MSDSQLYEETFLITTNETSKYDRVTRLIGHSIQSSTSHHPSTITPSSTTSNTGDTSLTLDINHEIYPVSPSEKLTLVLATTLNLDGTKDERGWRDIVRGGEQTLADLYDYVCRGRVYRTEEANGGEGLKVYASFGGLLLVLEGPWKKLAGVRLEGVYLLVKK